MNIVVDSSVVIAAILDNGPHGEWAGQVLTGGSLQAPELVRVEAMNVFRRLERAQVITTPEADAAHEDLTLLEMELFASEPFADRIWELRHQMTGSDAWYVALAEALELPLATLDKPLARAVGVTCQFWTPDV